MAEEQDYCDSCEREISNHCASEFGGFCPDCYYSAKWFGEEQAAIQEGE